MGYAASQFTGIPYGTCYSRMILNHPDATISIVETTNGKRRIQCDPREGLFTPIRAWETDYTPELIEHVLSVKGPDYLCDEIMRDEYELYVYQAFRWDILSYVGEEDMRGKRLLDFGSGSGASSMVLARMFDDTEIVGVELVDEYVKLARHRAKFYDLEDRVQFLVSPDPNSLPEGIGKFDYIIFSAVFEHLLPEERQSVLPLLWAHLKPGGVIFLDQTPYRWFPVEQHTTGMPLLNYLPDGLTHRLATKSKRVDADVTWPELLRKGIRGGTVKEIMGIFANNDCPVSMVQPSRLGVKDHIGLWYKLSATSRRPLIKKVMMWGLRTIKLVTGIVMIPTLSLAIRKSSEQSERIGLRRLPLGLGMARSKLAINTPRSG